MVICLDITGINQYNVGMYVAEIPNRHSPPAILLRESFRENGRVMNRTLANLSSWPLFSRIEALRRLLRGELDNVAVSDPTLGPTFGVLYALKHVAAEIGISSALGQSQTGKLGSFLVLARVAHQGSRLSAVRWAGDQAVAEVLGLNAFDEDDLYSTLMIWPPGKPRLRRRCGGVIWPGVERLRSCSSTMSPAPIWKANTTRWGNLVTTVMASGASCRS